MQKWWCVPFPRAVVELAAATSPRRNFPRRVGGHRLVPTSARLVEPTFGRGEIFHQS